MIGAGDRAPVRPPAPTALGVRAEAAGEREERGLGLGERGSLGMGNLITRARGLCKIRREEETAEESMVMPTRARWSFRLQWGFCLVLLNREEEEEIEVERRSATG